MLKGISWKYVLQKRRLHPCRSTCRQVQALLDVGHKSSVQKKIHRTRGIHGQDCRVRETFEMDFTPEPCARGH